MSTFKYQKWRKQENEQTILNALSDGNKAYGELLESTSLSKPILSERLKSLKEKGKIDAVPDLKTKKFLYHLKQEELDKTEEALIILHKLSMYGLDRLEEDAKDPSISDQEYVKRLEQTVATLLSFRIIAKCFQPIPQREEWIRNMLGSEFTDRVARLYSPKNRNIEPGLLFNEISAEEIAIYSSKNGREAVNKFIEIITAQMKKQ